MLEAIRMCEEISGKKLNCAYSKTARKGDHIWYISSLKKFRTDYPGWQFKYGLREIMAQIYNGLSTRL
jgi:CDP-paratose 2-epimerase